MVDPEDLRLVEDRGTCRFSSAASVSRVPNGFSITTRTRLLVAVEAVLAELPTVTVKNAGAVER